MKTIHKFNLDPVGSLTTMALPLGAKLRHVHMQHDMVCLWFEVDTNKPIKTRDFTMFGTGHPMPDNVPLEYCGTVHMGSFVFHVYEVL
ncbi:hypothetical protein Lumi_053 [Xylophilus phage Lumi]|nr:hypothetical protein Lumi_053 [Xylophilus phage Lumi]